MAKIERRFLAEEGWDEIARGWGSKYKVLSFLRQGKEEKLTIKEIQDENGDLIADSGRWT